MSKKKVFISFDFDNDKFLKDSIIGQSKNDDSPFEVSDIKEIRYLEDCGEVCSYPRRKAVELIEVKLAGSIGPRAHPASYLRQMFSNPRPLASH